MTPKSESLTMVTNAQPLKKPQLRSQTFVFTTNKPMRSFVVRLKVEWKSFTGRCETPAWCEQHEMLSYLNVLLDYFSVRRKSSSLAEDEEDRQDDTTALLPPDGIQPTCFPHTCCRHVLFPVRLLHVTVELYLWSGAQATKHCRFPVWNWTVKITCVFFPPKFWQKRFPVDQTLKHGWICFSAPQKRFHHLWCGR